ncbi:MAG: DUF3781 domain-containing protein [Clostridiales bacterium]|nr:DUF3781 domain-containing protein [Clostridiales bacterium]
MTKEQFRLMANLSPATSAAMSKGKGISCKVIERICVSLKLQPGDFMEYVGDTPPAKESKKAAPAPAKKTAAPPATESKGAAAPPTQEPAEKNELLKNIHKIRVTDRGAERIRLNIGRSIDNVVKWCTQKVKKADNIERRGKNWYVYAGDFEITINAQTYTIITAHKN